MKKLSIVSLLIIGLGSGCLKDSETRKCEEKCKKNTSESYVAANTTWPSVRTYCDNKCSK